MTPAQGRGRPLVEARRSNASRLLRAVHAGLRSRSDLGAALGVSRSTIGSLVAELGDRALVLEEGVDARGGRGRPSALVAPHPEGPAVLAAEIGVDGVTVALVGLGGGVRSQERLEWAREERDPERVASETATLASVVLKREPTGGIAGAGIAVPGLARSEDGFVALAPNLGWHDVPFGELLAERLPVSTPVSVGNEADLGALAEFVRGAGVGAHDLLYVSGEVGVGGGYICGGRPMKGRSGFAGEVGHMPVNPSGTPCRCGSVGCWETEVGEEALLRRAGRAGTGDRREMIGALLRDASDGERRALAALDEHGRWVGIGLAGLINVLNPGRIVLGGLLARLHPFFAERVAWELDRRCLQAAREGVEVVPAALGVNSALAGAAEMAFEGLLADPLNYPVPAPAVPAPAVAVDHRSGPADPHGR